MLRLGVRAVREGSDGGYRVAFRRPVYPGYRSAAHQYLDRLDETVADELFTDDPYWKQRLPLTRALHVLAETPCRLSDRDQRRQSHRALGRSALERRRTRSSAVSSSASA